MHYFNPLKGESGITCTEEVKDIHRKLYCNILILNIIYSLLHFHLQ